MILTSVKSIPRPPISCGFFGRRESKTCPQDREQNTLCYLLTAGKLPWGVCYDGYLGLDDISVNSAPLQTSWAFWHTVTISQVTCGMRTNNLDEFAIS